jgi:hypothetical protein
LKEASAHFAESFDTSRVFDSSGPTYVSDRIARVNKTWSDLFANVHTNLVVHHFEKFVVDLNGPTKDDEQEEKEKVHMSIN